MDVRTLILEDHIFWREEITEILEEEGHKIEVAESLIKAKKLLHETPFHLVIIDIVLGSGNIEMEGAESGLDLLEIIKSLNISSPHLTCGYVIITGNEKMENAVKAIKENPVYLQEESDLPIVLKRGIDGEGFKPDEFLRVTRNELKKVLLKRAELYEKDRYSFIIDLIPGQRNRTELRHNDEMFFDKRSASIFDLDIDSFTDRTDNLQFNFSAQDEEQRLKWRPIARSLGEDLYQKLFDKDLTTNLNYAKGLAVDNPLHIVFKGTNSMIKIPIELLPGKDNSGYLITENPIIRQISEITNTRQGIGLSFFKNIEEIKILLIASNTFPEIPGVDDEIALLEENIPKIFKLRGFNINIKTLLTKDATYDRVREALKNCSYHMVHYAGHGFHNSKESDKSGILFWENPDSSGDVKHMPIHVLKMLLAKSDTRFFYLSCCVGAKGSSESYTKLKGSDFQGILEGLVRAGVPCALGYRWNVVDSEAKELALSFYENLIEYLRPDIALFEARQKLQEDNYFSETWASPILISQTL